MNETRNPFPSLSSQVKTRRRKRNQPFSLQFLNQRKESSLELEFPFLKEKRRKEPSLEPISLMNDGRKESGQAQSLCARLSVSLLRSFLILLYWSSCGAAFPISSFTITSFSFLSSLSLTLSSLYVKERSILNQD